MRTRRGNRNGSYFIPQLLSYKSPQSYSFLLEFTEHSSPQTSMNYFSVVPGSALVWYALGVHTVTLVVQTAQAQSVSVWKAHSISVISNRVTKTDLYHRK